MAGQWRRDSDKRLKSTGHALQKKEKPGEIVYASPPKKERKNVIERGYILYDSPPKKDYSYIGRKDKNTHTIKKRGRDTKTYTPYGIGRKEKTPVSYNLNRACGYCGTRIHDKKQVEFCTFNCYRLHLNNR